MNESRAARHQRLRRRNQAIGLLSCGVLLALLVVTPAATALADWSLSVTAGMPGPTGALVSLALFVAVLVAAWETALFPAVLIGKERGGMAVVVAALVAWPVAFLVAATIQVSVAAVGHWWWLASGGVMAVMLIAAMHVAPEVLARISGARPVTRASLVERLGALSRRIDVPIESVDQLPPGAAATSTALVAGAGRSRRVFIAADLVQDWSDDEIAIVVAHEFAHHANHDLWRTLALDAAILSAGFWVADRAAATTGTLFVGVGIGSMASLPFVALVVGIVWAIATPLRHAVSRNQERRADAFALEITDGAEAFRTALRRLASRHLAEERPSRLTQWWFHRHPTVAERLATADRYAQRTLYRSNGPSIHRSN